MRLVLLLVLLAVAAPASAQQYASRSNDRLVERAVTELGGNYRQRGMPDAIQRAFTDLYPESSWGRYRLSEVQARAVAFIALEYAPRPYPNGGGWPTPGDDRGPVGGYGACRDVNARLYDLALAIPEDRFSLFLSDEEVARLRTDLTAIGRDAAACGCRSVSDGVLALVRQVSGTTMPRRSDTIQGLDRLRQQADACR